MIKTLRITSFAAAVIALGFLIVIAARGMAANEKVENLLKLPSVAEQFQTGQKPADGEQETPLIKQARAFALRIDPPPPPEPVKPQQPSETPRPQVAISAKFKLIGTSYHFGDEADSWALVDEVGKGLHWVKQGNKVGYLIIERVGDGSVLINDNGKTYELIAERVQKPDFVKSYTGVVPETKPIILLPVEEKAKKAESNEPVSVPNADNAETSVPQPTPEEARQQTQETIDWIKQLQQDPNALGMTPEEANELGGMGELLKSLESEQQQLKDTIADANNLPQVTEVNQVTEDQNSRDVNTPNVPDANKQPQPRSLPPESPKRTRR
jgi:hypothetical protein